MRLRRPLPFGAGLGIIGAVLEAQARPRAALAACELRSPAAMSPDEFKRFNEEYRSRLDADGFGAVEACPIARSNLAPRFDAPAGNTLFAFTYALPTTPAMPSATPAMVADVGPDFVISGKPENTAESPGVVAPGDVSPAGMRRKCAHVIAALRERVDALGARWSDITGANIYTLQPLDAMLELFAQNGLLHAGATLVPSLPPLIGFDFEIDVRCVRTERVV